MNASAPPKINSAYPWRFLPVYKDYLWGGDRIIRHFGKPKINNVCAESWEVSVRPEGPSIIANGPDAGKPLADLFRGADGSSAADRQSAPQFPLLLKLIDARNTLSIQVHPNDETAAKFGGEAKTEMWYILAADPGACVYCGLKLGTDETKLRAALAEKRVGDLLQKIPVQPGDAIFVPGGRVHAIGTGCLIFECQQNSNTTFRLYDWDRNGPDGRPRELHTEQSMRVINWNDTAPAKISPQPLPSSGRNRRALVLETKYFRMERLDLAEPLTLENGRGGFQILFIAEGSLEIRSPDFSEIANAGTTYFLPAALARAELIPRDAAAVLRVTA